MPEPATFAPGARVLPAVGRAPFPATAGSRPVLYVARHPVRDAEWLVQRVDRSSTGRQVPVRPAESRRAGLCHKLRSPTRALGRDISEIVSDKKAIFLTEIESQIDVLDPARTALVRDASPGYRAIGRATTQSAQ